MRIILYTGKGGVGKTSVAAATACKIASGGKKVLIVSTDQAHSLRDSFDIKLSNEPLKISNNLYAMEINSVLENENSWGNIKSYFEKLMVFKSEKTIETEELLVFPGFEELLALIKIKDIYDEGKYDVLIVDCVPTGETMSLLKFPDLFKWWMEKIFPIKRKGAKIAKPIIEATIKMPMPTDNTFDEIEKLYIKIDELHSLMLDKNIVSIRIVTTAEKIVVKEAKRSFSYPHLFDYNVDAIIINKIFSKDSLKGYFEGWTTIQKESIDDIYDSFKGIPIFKLELMSDELREYNTLQNVGNKIYKEVNPEDVLFQDKIFTIEKNAEGYNLVINMPFVDKRELNLSQKGDEITISIKNERRSFVLPTKLHSKEITCAKYIDGKLNIHFA
ncbi:arsenite-transporting ATPase [Clostridium tetanomorphum]|uniref:ArsA family ATPase n=1 Tax=Clostridium tetanomorphum TaxID=1553 RepID=UPI00044DB0B9|nr:ArsA family ATPase [Clostridium tetanomorphum]KAJ51668.1 arsenite-activated ATPase ArsA [Clostridium tetanomorphum DSM 665]KAJ51948.1 arsenite-activated ATPase ArsA [Clostridium tetanomorphum DSM 665]MBP1864043.1 arsenite-transporting ATPase [Clostridium tetanomorphum]NRS84455.1 arsenite-transporting ATPase [Clostridium tetanomorphum]